MMSDIESWLDECIGNKLDAVLALIYVYNNKKDYVNPQELDIHFFFSWS